jgi:peptidoglycan LD-endopeptidase LytH
VRSVWLIPLGLLIGAAGYGCWHIRTDDGPSLAEAIATAGTRLPEPVQARQGAHTPPAAAGGEAPTLPRATVTAVAPPATGDDDGLLVPIEGVARAQLRDTFSDARSEGRVHDAIDIMASAGTPVLAVADGSVEKLFDSRRGGLTVYQFEPSGRYCYYYAHLQRYADGLAEGQPLRRGQLIGYVGSSGNASADAPHLHFEVHRLGADRHWWQGEALNPYPLLHGDADQATP